MITLLLSSILMFYHYTSPSKPAPFGLPEVTVYALDTKNNIGIENREYSELHRYDIRYPKTNVRSIDEQISDVIDSLKFMTSELEEPSDQQKLALKVNYSMHPITKQYQSLIFEAHLYLEDGTEETFFLSYVLNLESEILLPAEDLIRESSDEKILDLLAKSLLQKHPEQEKSLMDYKETITTSYVYEGVQFNESTMKIYFYPQLLSDNLNETVIVELDFNQLKEDLLFLDQEDSTKPIVVDKDPIQEENPKPPVPKETKYKYVAFTFDDGPYKPVDDRLMKAFKKVDGQATFFVLGNRVPTYVQTLKELVLNGHQIGNHSYDHFSFIKISSSKLQEQINKTNQIIHEYTSIAPSIVRPPYGAVNKAVKSQIEYPLIHWNIDTLDWKSKNAKSIKDIIRRQIKDGSIILMHDLYASTAQAIESILPELYKEGYRFVTIDELFKVKGISLKPNHQYFSIHNIR